MKNIILFLAFSLILIVLPVLTQDKPSMRIEDKIRIREAMNISEQFGDRIWEGFSKAPFALILVTDSVEFLINHPNPTRDFTFLSDDSILQTKVYFRMTQFSKQFLATFPAVDGLNCIVAGTPENTDRRSTNWTITILHEHFHQYVYSSPGYYQSVDSLNLSGGDKTGMWMLNYPFPYDSSLVIKAYDEYMEALSKTITEIDSTYFQANVKAYIEKRKAFQQALSPSDYKYFSFQIWQEGIARYTEYKFLELLNSNDVSGEIAKLSDYVPFTKYKEAFYKFQIKQLTSLHLNESKRDCFYAIGCAEGLLLDRLNPTWREKYLKEKFFIERYSDVLK